MGRWADHPAAGWVLAAAALAAAAAGARPVAGGWHDGSRLAAVEALVEHGTFCIDGTVFAAAPPPGGVSPAYDPDSIAAKTGTLDKLLIDGRFYSDKPLLVNLPLAAAYRGLMAVGFPAPSERPDVFAWTVTVLLSGVGYAAAVGCMWAVGTRVGLSPGWRLAWVGAFALATVLPAYTRHANTHLAQLGAVAGVCALLGRIADAAAAGRTAWGSLAAAGLLTGFAYHLDYGVGPPLAPAVLVAVAVRTRRLGPVVACGLGMLPLVLAGHAVNAAVAGEWLRPPNMNPEFLSWPGSPFDATNITGVARPRPVAQFLYALDLLFGKKGFVTHNPPLLLAATAGLLVLFRPGRDRAELLALAAWAAAGWALYGVLSKNHGGGCVSVRWFLPFLAPGFWLLARVLVERPGCRPDFVILSAWGAVLAAAAWAVGPWTVRVVPGYWVVFAGSLVTWAVLKVVTRGPSAARR
jgi:hypothetical protein